MDEGLIISAEMKSDHCCDMVGPRFLLQSFNLFAATQRMVLRYGFHGISTILTIMPALAVCHRLNTEASLFFAGGCRS